MYLSPWFIKARTYAERRASWFILSAEYGLLHPDVVIDPYERTLNTMSVGRRRLWAASVTSQVRQTKGYFDQEIEILAGQKYREFLGPALADLGFSVSVPMLGLGIGQQLQWLSRQ